MEIDLILIPTLGRFAKQRTYNNFSPRLKEMTRFVVQAQEAEEMEKLFPGKVIVLPEEIKTLSPTCQWIWENFSDRRYLRLDDDLRYYFKWKEEDRFKFKVIKEDDHEMWDDLLDTVEKLMDEGYSLGSFKSTGVVPDSKRFPIEKNIRFMSAFYIDGPNCPKDIDWNRLPLSQDFDVSLQWASRGLKSCNISNYCIESRSYSKGGCNTYRTIDFHNEVMLKLQSMWPKYVRLREKKIHESHDENWANKIVYRAVINMNKCYQDAIKSKRETE